jgi:hypothetical protein
MFPKASDDARILTLLPHTRTPVPLPLPPFLPATKRHDDVRRVPLRSENHGSPFFFVLGLDRGVAAKNPAVRRAARHVQYASVVSSAARRSEPFASRGGLVLVRRWLSMAPRCCCGSRQSSRPLCSALPSLCRTERNPFPLRPARLSSDRSVLGLHNGHINCAPRVDGTYMCCPMETIITQCRVLG